MPRLSELQQAIFLCLNGGLYLPADLVLNIWQASSASNARATFFPYHNERAANMNEAGDEASADECEEVDALNKVDCVYPYARQC